MGRLPLVVAALAAALAFGAVMLLSQEDGGEPELTPAATTGLAVFNRMGCGSCHRLAAAGSEGPIGQTSTNAWTGTQPSR